MTAAAVGVGPQALRRPPTLVPMPNPDPPYDDELDGPATMRERGRPHRSAAAHAAPVLATPPSPAAAPAPAHPDTLTRPPAGPPVPRTAAVLARGLVEVLSGHRPLAQLRSWCALPVYQELLRRPPRATTPRPQLLSVHTSEPAAGAAEVCATFRRSDRVRVLAFRMQRRADDGWRITALEVG